MSEDGPYVRRWRRRSTWVIVAAIIVIPVLAGLVSWVARPAEPTPLPSPTGSPTASPTGSPTASPTASPTESPTTSPTPTPLPNEPASLLFQVRTDDGLAMVDSLWSTADRAAAVVQMQPGLVIDAHTAGPMSLAEAARLPDTMASVDAVTDLLGVHVSAGLMLDRLAFAGLVDSGSGVAVNVTQTLVVKDPAGKVLVDLQPGSQVLNGIEAAYYITAIFADESDQQRAARVTDIETKVFASLSSEAERLRELLTSLGSLARSTVPPEQLVPILQQLQAESSTGEVTGDVLPATLVRGGMPGSYVVDPVAARIMLTRLMPQEILKPGKADRPRVTVLRNSGDFVVASAARDALVSDGFAYVEGERSADPVVPRTHIYVAAGTPDGLGLRIAQALGVASTAIIEVDPRWVLSDARVVLGLDARTALLR